MKGEGQHLARCAGDGERAGASRRVVMARGTTTRRRKDTTSCCNRSAIEFASCGPERLADSRLQSGW